MGALGLLAIAAGIIFIRSAVSGDSPKEVVLDFLDSAKIARFQGWGGGGGFSAGVGGGSGWEPSPGAKGYVGPQPKDDPTIPENVR